MTDYYNQLKDSQLGEMTDLSCTGMKISETPNYQSFIISQCLEWLEKTIIYQKDYKKGFIQEGED